MDWKWGAIFVLGVILIAVGSALLTQERSCPITEKPIIDSNKNYDISDQGVGVATSGKYSPAEVEKNVFNFLWALHELHVAGGDSGEYMLINKAEYSKLKAQMYDLYIPNWERLNEEYARK